MTIALEKRGWSVVLMAACAACGCGMSPPGAATRAIGGTVTGLTAAGLVLHEGAGGGEDLEVGQDATAFAFAGHAAAGAAYQVSIGRQPAGLTCTIQNEIGVVVSVDVTTIAVTCSVCSGRSGGSCSTTTTSSCAYDRDCPVGETCGWRQSRPRFRDGADGTVTDRRTCLTWEKKTGAVATADGWVMCTGANCPDPHDVNALYTWSTGAPFSWALDGTATTDFLAKLNASPGFAGHDDWRLPTVAGRADMTCPSGTGLPVTTRPCTTGQDPELESILLAPYPCGSSPCIDTTVFGPTQARPYWSSSSYPATPYPSATPGATQAWYLYFGDGSVIQSAKIGYQHVRAVRRFTGSAGTGTASAP